jgi:hypothetical protein
MRPQMRRNCPQSKDLRFLPESGIQRFSGLARQYYRFRHTLLIKI